LDDLSSGSLSNLAHLLPLGLEFIQGDVCDADSCNRAAAGCSGIFHEAALVSVFDSVAQPLKNHAINSTGTLNILEAARTQGVKRIVFASSAAIYGENPSQPKSEEMLPEPKSPYAVAKMAGEHYLATYAGLFGLECVALRYFNVYGPRQDATSMYSGVISKFMDHVLKGTAPTIFGDGQQGRDFVHVSDVVQANILAMCEPLPHPFVASNVATGRETSLLQLIDAINCSSAIQLVPEFAPVRTGDIRHSLASIQKAQSILGYSPEVMDLKLGLSDIMQIEVCG